VGPRPIICVQGVEDELKNDVGTRRRIVPGLRYVFDTVTRSGLGSDHNTHVADSHTEGKSTRRNCKHKIKKKKIVRVARGFRPPCSSSPAAIVQYSARTRYRASPPPSSTWVPACMTGMPDANAPPGFGVRSAKALNRDCASPPWPRSVAP